MHLMLYEGERGREMEGKSEREREREWNIGVDSDTWPFGLCKDDSTPCWAESKKLNHLLATHSHTGEGARLSREQPVKRWMTAAVTSFAPLRVQQYDDTEQARLHVKNWMSRTELHCCVCAPHVSPPSPQSPWMFYSSHVSFFTFAAHLLLPSLTLPVSFIFLSTAGVFSRLPSSAVDPHVVKQQQTVSERRAHLVPGCCLRKATFDMRCLDSRDLDPTI